MILVIHELKISKITRILEALNNAILLSNPIGRMLIGIKKSIIHITIFDSMLLIICPHLTNSPCEATQGYLWKSYRIDRFHADFGGDANKEREGGGEEDNVDGERIAV